MLNTSKEILLIPGAKIWTVSHLKVRVLQIDEIGCWILPSGITLEESGRLRESHVHNFTRIHLKIKDTSVFRSVVVYNKLTLENRVKELIKQCHEESSSHPSYKGIPIVTRATGVVYLTLTQILKKYTTLEECLSVVDQYVFDFVKDNNPGKTKEWVKELIYFGKLFNKLAVVHESEEVFGNLLGLSVSSVKCCRSSGVIAKRLKNALLDMDVWSKVKPDHHVLAKE